MILRWKAVSLRLCSDGRSPKYFLLLLICPDRALPQDDDDPYNESDNIIIGDHDNNKLHNIQYLKSYRRYQAHAMCMN